MVLLEVGMCKSLLDADPLVRVEGQHLVQEVESARIGIRVEPLPWLLDLLRKRQEVRSRLKMFVIAI